MKHEQRHVFVESPDGNIFIGTNPDIEAPPIVETIIGTQSQQRTHMQIHIEYHEISQLLLFVHSLLALYVLVMRTLVIDIIITVSLATSIYSVYSGKVEGRPILLFQSICCFVTVPIIILIYHPWWDVGYLFSLGIHLLLTVYFSKMGIRERRS
tara:strand:+ start:1295 stop:1756 length:462 start_codon:yes stop_codon:yes gene_type:complete